MYDTFESLGLKMHIGGNGGRSKTEPGLFPPSLKADQCKHLYTDEKITVPGGYVTFENNLGSWATRTSDQPTEHLPRSYLGENTR